MISNQRRHQMWWGQRRRQGPQRRRLSTSALLVVVGPLLLLLSVIRGSCGLSSSSSSRRLTTDTEKRGIVGGDAARAKVHVVATATATRADFMRITATAAAAATGTMAAAPPMVPPALASLTPSPGVSKGKRIGLSDDELCRIVTSDIVDRSFLVTADLTRDIYDDRSVFIDEIDSYPMDKWIVGTKRLFVSEGSRVDLIGNVLVTPTEVTFRFDEDLMFCVPFRPVVHLSGRVVLDRDVDSGLITGYREFWDQDVASVLRTAKIRASDGSLKPFPIIGAFLK